MLNNQNYYLGKAIYKIDPKFVTGDTHLWTPLYFNIFDNKHDIYKGVPNEKFICRPSYSSIWVGNIYELIIPSMMDGDMLKRLSYISDVEPTYVRILLAMYDARTKKDIKNIEESLSTFFYKDREKVEEIYIRKNINLLNSKVNLFSALLKKKVLGKGSLIINKI